VIVLLDQDGVLADFERGFVEAWRRRHSDLPWIEAEARRRFHLTEDYPVEHHARVAAVYGSRGFFRHLAPIPGAIEGVREMLAEGLDVRICTKSIEAYEHCVVEKYQWVEEHLGREFTRRMILTSDKTLVRGDWLVDDNPLIEGAHVPAWRHAVFDAPYNRHLTDAVRVTWANWRRILR
jgi:5'-nucleotidase